MQTIIRKGKKFVLVPLRAWEQLASGEIEMPRLPKADADGNMPAVEFSRASIARTIIRYRVAAGISRAELARRAGIPVERLSRIEQAAVTPDVPTITRIDRALKAAIASSRRGNSAVSSAKRTRA